MVKKSKKLSYGIMGYERLAMISWFGILKCGECFRHIPNKNWITKNGCIWCDAEYHWSKK